MKIIVAFQKINNGIGKNNKIPWPIDKNDLNLFKSLTVNQKIIIGYNTYISLPNNYLKNRENIIFTSKKIENKKTIFSLNQIPKDSIVIGGQKLYESTMDLVNTIYASIFKCNYECDRFFPNINLNIWKEFSNISFENFDFKTYIRE